MRMADLNYGDRVIVVKGRYKGHVGIYDDDADNIRASIICPDLGGIIVHFAYLQKQDNESEGNNE